LLFFVFYEVFIARVLKIKEIYTFTILLNIIKFSKIYFTIYSFINIKQDPFKKIKEISVKMSTKQSIDFKFMY